jgi:hypothetical protein
MYAASSNHTSWDNNHQHYNSLHLYVAGQMYMMSTDLVQRTVDYVSSSENIAMIEEYHHVHEDHDMSTYALLFIENTPDQPITMVMVPHQNPF